MAIDTSALTEYSWADIQKAAKQAMITAAVGGSNYAINGRSFGRISIKEAKELYELATQMIADESTESGGGIALVRYGERM